MHTPARIRYAALFRPAFAAVRSCLRAPRAIPSSLALLALTLALTAAVPARAATVSWLSAVSGNWNDNTKWSGGVAPGASDIADISVAGTYTVTVNVNPLVQSINLGGASGTQTLTSTGRTIDAAGGVVVGANGHLTLNNTIVLGSLDNAGTVAAAGASQTSTLSGGLTTQAGSLLQIAGAVTLSVPGSVTNLGTIASTGSSAVAVLSLTGGGTLTNAAGGTLTTASGNLNLDAILDNQGAINTIYRLNLVPTGVTHTNTGSITLSNAASVYGVAWSNATFNHAGGSLAGPGYVTVTGGGTFNGVGGNYGAAGEFSFNASTGSFASLMPTFDMTFTAGSTLTGGVLTTAGNVTLTNSAATPTSLVNAAGKTLTLNNSSISSPLHNAGTLAAAGSGQTSTLSGGLTTQALSQVQIAGAVTLSVPGSVTNLGTIASTGATAVAVLVLTGGGTLTNAAGATLTTTGGNLNLDAILDNQGAITTIYRLNLVRTAVTHTNSGSITLGNAASIYGLAFSNATFNHTGGSMAGPGYVTVTGGGTFNGVGGSYGAAGEFSFNASTGSFASLMPTFDMAFAAASTLTGGVLTTAGNVTLTNSTATPTSLVNASGKTLTLNNSTVSSLLHNAGTLAVAGGGQTSTLSGGLTTQALSQVQIAGAVTLSVPGNVTNLGTIASTGATAVAVLVLTGGGTLTNGAIGTVTTQSGNLEIQAAVDNQGAILTNYRLAWNKPGAAHKNAGAINITNPASVYTLLVTGASLEITGGSGSGAGYLELDGTPLVGGATTTTNNMQFSNATATCASLTNAAGKELWLYGTSSIACPFNNAGTLVAAPGSNAAITGAMTTVAGSTIDFKTASTLTVADGFTSLGILKSSGTSSAQTLVVTSGTFTNGPAGSISTQSGNLALNAQVDHQGAILTNYRLAWNKAGAAHRSSGAIDITNPASVYTLLVTGASLEITGGSGSGAGYLELDGTPLVGGATTTTNNMQFSNATATCASLTNAAGKELWLYGTSSIACPFHNAGTLLAAVGSNASISGAMTTVAGSTIDFKTASTLTVANGFTSHGILKSSGTSSAQTLVVTSGTFTNGPAGSISTQSGNLALNAQVDHQGAILTNYRLAWNKAGAAHRSSGAIDITNPASVYTLLVTGASLEITGGSGSGAGYLELDGTPLVGGATTTTNNMQFSNATATCASLTNAAGKELWLYGTSSIACPFHNAGTLLAAVGSNASISGAMTTAAGSTIDFKTASTLTVANGFTSHGILKSSGASNAQTLVVTSGTFTNGPAGSISTQSGNLALNAQVDHQGAILTNYRLAWNKAGAAHRSSGAIDITNPATVYTLLVTGASLEITGGSGSGDGYMELNGTALVGGATTTINHMLFSNATATCASLTNTAGKELWLYGTSSIACPFHNAGTLLAAVGSNASISGAMTTAAGSTIDFKTASTLTVANGFTSHGILKSSGASNAQTLVVTSGTFTNGPAGSISTQSGNLALNAQVDHQGAILTNYRLAWNKAGAAHTSSGAIDITNPASVYTLLVTGASLEITGGSGSGDGYMELNGTALVGGATTTINHMLFSNATATCASLTNAAGKELWLYGTSSIACPFDNAGTLVAAPGSNASISGAMTTVAGSTIDFKSSSLLTVASGFTSHGILKSSGASNAQTLVVSSGTFTNGATGSISTQGGNLELRAQWLNLGATTTNHRLRLNKTGAIHANSGTITIGLTGANSLLVSSGSFVNMAGGIIRGDGELDVSGVTFTNQGTLSPGTSPGLLRISGHAPHTLTSNYDAEFASANNSDRVVVTGTATLNGRLALRVLGAYQPALGDSFVILTAGSVVDTFRTVTGRMLPGGRYARMVYEPTRVRVFAGLLPPNNAPTAVDDAFSCVEDDTTIVNPVLNDTDPDADSLRITVLGGAAHGSVVLRPDGTVHYVPVAQYSGPDQFSYTIFDGRDGTSTATVFITVIPRNDPPVFDYPPTPPDQTVFNVTTGNPVAFTVRARDLDAAGSVTVSVSGVPAGASLVPALPVNGNPVTSSFSWTPGAGQTGLYTLTFSASDDSSGAVSSVVQIQVTGAPMTCGPGHHWIDICPAGVEDMSSGALIGLDLIDDGNLDGDTDMSFVLGGPVRVRHTSPLDASAQFPGIGVANSHLDVKDTEIVSLSLTGGGITVTAGAGLGAGGVLGASLGTIHEQAANDSLGGSFFDVYFEVQTPLGTFYNHDPLRINNVIDRLPPGGTYEHPQGLVALYTAPVGGTQVANLVTARHILNAPPVPVACGTAHWVDQAPGGFDSQPTEADVGLDLLDDGNLDGVADVSFRLQGPVAVERSGPRDVSQNFLGVGAADGHFDVIDTEMLSMQLVGGAYTLKAGAGQSPLAPTKGVVVERANDPTLANSFFDVFFVVETPVGPVYNQTPLRVESIVDCVPPHAQYLHPMGSTVQLFTSPIPGQGTHVANLVNARHSVGAPAPCDQPHWVDVAPSGTDSPDSEADVGIDLMDDGNLDGQADQSFRLRGPVTVRRSAGRDASANYPGVGTTDGHKDVIDTEILSMSLADQGVTLTVGAGLGQGGVLSASRGAILEQPANPRLADSFFDVFFEVMTPAGPAYNQTPLHMSSIIDCVPPVTSYIHPDSLIPLYSSPIPGQGVHVANLVTAQHIVGGGPVTGTCAITGPDSSCIGFSNTYRVPRGPLTTGIHWSVSGDGRIEGSADLDSVVVTGIASKSYTVSVTLTEPRLVQTCEKRILVIDCTTASMLSLFEAQPLEHGVELRWQFGDPSEISSVRLERAELPAGAWSVIEADRVDEDGAVATRDLTVEPGHLYTYRLIVTTTAGQTLTFGPLTVTAGQQITEFSLGAPMPNPTQGSVKFEFALPRESNVHLSVLDVAGREVATLVTGRHRAGRYQAIWNGETSRGRAPAGLYMIRFKTPDHTIVRRVAMIR